MNKLSIIGSINISIDIAENIANNDKITDITLIDTNESIEENIINRIESLNTNITIKAVTNNYEETNDSHVILIIPNIFYDLYIEDDVLIENNEKYIKTVISETIKYSPNAIYIIAVNPVDTMAQLAINELGTTYADHIIGFGNILDTESFKYSILNKYNNVFSENPISIDDIKNAYVIGGHNITTMIPLINRVKIFGRTLLNIFSEIEISDIIHNTIQGTQFFINFSNKNALEIIIQHLYKLIDKLFSINNSFIVELLPVSVYRSIYDICIGSLVNINYNGVDKIYAEENSDQTVYIKFMNSVKIIQENNKLL